MILEKTKEPSTKDRGKYLQCKLFCNLWSAKVSNEMKQSQRQKLKMLRNKKKSNDDYNSSIHEFNEILWKI